MYNPGQYEVQKANIVYNFAVLKYSKEDALNRIIIADCYHCRKYARTVTEINYKNGRPLELSSDLIPNVTIADCLYNMSKTDLEAFNKTINIKNVPNVNNCFEFFDDTFQYVYHLTKTHKNIIMNSFNECQNILETMHGEKIEKD